MPASVALIALGIGAMLLGRKVKLPGLPDPVKGPGPDVTKFLVEYRQNPEGKTRYWLTSVAPTIALKMGNRSVEKTFDGEFRGARVVVYRLGTGNIVEGTLSAYDILTVSSNAGAATLVSMSLWDDSGDAYMVCLPRNQRTLWTSNCPQLAVISDGVDAGIPSPKVPSGDKDKPGDGLGPGPGDTQAKKAPPDPYGPKGGEAPDPTSDEFWQYDMNMDHSERVAALAYLAVSQTRESLLATEYAAANCGMGHGGHPKLAAAIAAKRLKAYGPDPAAPTSFPYTIKADGSDWPYSLAKTYTGNGNRWKEILPLNPQLKVGTTTDTQEHDKEGQPVSDDWDTPQGDSDTGKTYGNTFQAMSGETGVPSTVTTVTPWNAGQVIQLPISWSKGA